MVNKKWAFKLNDFGRETVKQALGFPVWVCKPFFYVTTIQGGLGLRSIEDDLASLMLTFIVKMLTTPDRVTIYSLDLTIHKR